MSTTTHPESTATEVYDWLLDPHESQRPNRKQLRDLAAKEAVILTCYLLVATSLDSTYRAAIQEILADLDLPEGFVDWFQQTSKETDMRVPEGTNVEQLFVNPPPQLVVVLNQLVCNWFSRNQTRNRLTPLSPIVFQHPEDRELLRKLSSIPGIHKLVGKGMDFYFRQQQLMLMANGIEVNQDNLAYVAGVVDEASEILGVYDRPAVYVTRGPINAFCIGAERPFIQLNSGLINIMNRDELLFVVGHELGHAMSGHAKFHMLAALLSEASKGVLTKLTLGLSDVLMNATISPLLNCWMRRSELTADRAGYLTCQNLEASLRALMKLAGFPMVQYGNMRTDAFLTQARNFDVVANDQFLDRARNISLYWTATHPMATARAAHLVEWVDSGFAGDIIEATLVQRQSMNDLAAGDSGLFPLLISACSAVEDWAESQFGTHGRSLRSQIRQLLLQKSATELQPLNCVLRASLTFSRRKTGVVRYLVEILFQSDDEIQSASIPIQDSVPMDEVPYSVRKAWMRNGTDELSYIVYSIENDA